MAQVPHYFDNHSESQQLIPENGPQFYNPYSQGRVFSVNRQSSSNPGCVYQPNSYQCGFSQSNLPFPPSYNVHSPAVTQSNIATFPTDLQTPYFKQGISSDVKACHQSNNVVNASAGNYGKNYGSDELDDPLSEIPMESLLHLTKHEDELLSETEAHHGRPFETSDIILGDDDLSSSIYSSSSKDLLLGSDRDDEDSSSTMYSVTSTPDSVVSTPSQNKNYDPSSAFLTAPNGVSTCSSSTHGSANFSDSLINSPSYSLNSPNAYMGTSPCYPDRNCTPNTVNSYSPSGHAMLPSSPVPDYSHNTTQHYSPNASAANHGVNLQNFDKQETCSQGVKTKGEANVRKSTRTNKKSAKLDQGGPKKPKKHKVADALNVPSNGFVSSGNDSSGQMQKTSVESSQRIFSGDDSDIDDPSDENSASQPKPKEQLKEMPIKRKRMRCPRGMKLEVKPCQVCGDKAKNMHFGGLVCDSCKAFFRRSVQSETWDEFKCEKDENCVITKANRRCCQYCRFQKCEKVGMLKEWVMTESGRMCLLKNRLARTRQMKKEKELETVYGELPRALSPDDATAINEILNTLHTTFGSMLYPKQCVGDSIDTLSNIFVYLCKRFGLYFLKITDETDLCQEDRTLLLKNGISMSLYINGAHMYDPVTRSWPASSCHESIKVPHVTLETLQKLAAIPDAFATIMKFYDKYAEDLKDHVVAVLMYLISFFLGDDPNFKDGPGIQKIQDTYIGYLKRYLIARDGYESLTGIFLKLIEGISYVKDILKYHTVVDIKPTIDHTHLNVFDKESITSYMTNLISQIELSLSGYFPPYASVLNEKEKESLGMSSKSNVLVKKGTRSVMLHHPDTIAMFGATTRTDALITHPLQNMIEWRQNDLVGPQSPIGFGECEPLTFSNEDADLNEGEECSGDSDNNQQVDVDAVCDILKQLSHTDDTKMINIFKKNIPKELLENFSRTLSNNDP